MARIDFYHLTSSTLDEALPKLVSKAYDTRKNIKIKIGTPERVDFLNALLWTFDDESFLPHGIKKDGFADMQPIYLSSDDENLNDAKLLFVVDGADIQEADFQNFDRIFYIFNAKNDVELSKARSAWKNSDQYSSERHYWQQTSSNTWQEKNLS